MNKSMEKNSFIKVFAIDDESIVLWGLESMFRDRSGKIRIIGKSNSIDDAIAQMNKLDFDIILLDLWLKKSDPLENVKELKEYFKEKPIVIYTVEDFNEWKIRMYKAGVSAFILKSALKCEIKSILIGVAKGQKLFDFNKIPMERLSYYNFLRKKFDFTEFQVRILFLLSEGYQEKQIADELNTTLSCINKALITLRGICHANNNNDMIYTILT